MDSRRSPTGSVSLGRRLHALVERYTPDGSLGRFLLGATTGSVGLWLLALVLFEIPRWGLSLAALFWTPVLLGFGVPALLLSIAVLWPLYLSLIGNIDSADGYSVSGTTESSTTRAGESVERGGSLESSRDPSEIDPADPFADLKRQYANGKISEAEFEQRLEARLGDDLDQSETNETSASERDRMRTPGRN